jgi:GTPase KRas
MCEVDDHTALLDILDTAGAPEYAAMRELYLTTANAILVLYAVDNRESFDAVDEIVTAAKKADNIVVLAGNKSDKEAERVITEDEGRDKAAELECDGFMETSAKSGDNVNEAFYNLVRLVRSPVATIKSASKK